MMTERKQKPEAVTNGNNTANGMYIPSITSSYDDGPNAWSTAGAAAFDFRSA